MKKLCSLLLVICLLTGLFSGCTASNRTLSDFQKDMISEAVHRLDGYSVSWTVAYYYGKFDGYHVLLNPGGLMTAQSEEIGEYTFHYTSGFHMYAYKLGKAYSLQDAYEQDLISDEAMAQIYAAHQEMLREKFPPFLDEINP